MDYSTYKFDKSKVTVCSGPRNNFVVWGVFNTFAEAHNCVLANARKLSPAEREAMNNRTIQEAYVARQWRGKEENQEGFWLEVTEELLDAHLEYLRKKLYPDEKVQETSTSTH